MRCIRVLTKCELASHAIQSGKPRKGLQIVHWLA